MPKEEREQLGERGLQHVLKNYNFENFQQQWVDIIDNVCEKYGSWEDRKLHTPWNLVEIK